MSWGYYGLEYIRGESGTPWSGVYVGLSRGHYGLEYQWGESWTLWPGVSAS